MSLIVMSWIVLARREREADPALSPGPGPGALFGWHVMVAMMVAAVAPRVDHRQVREIFAREAILYRSRSRARQSPICP
jgi:hypothetical protein